MYYELGMTFRTQTIFQTKYYGLMPLFYSSTNILFSNVRNNFLQFPITNICNIIRCITKIWGEMIHMLMPFGMKGTWRNWLQPPLLQLATILALTEGVYTLVVVQLMTIHTGMSGRYISLLRENYFSPCLFPWDLYLWKQLNVDWKY